MDILIGFLLGLLVFVSVRLFLINLREKRGMHAVRYSHLPLRSKMMNIIRRVIFNFSIEKFNSDFLLDLKVDGTHLMQIMHRAHFPEVCKNISDVKFGLAIYIPTKPLTPEQKLKLQQLLKEESEDFITHSYPVEYFVIDAGSRVRFTGYLIARIVAEVFQKEDIEWELYDEGTLPYHYPLETRKVNGAN